MFIYLVNNKILLGMRMNRGPRYGQLEWRQPRYLTVRRILTHPNYAGAYVFGRKEVEKGKAVHGPTRADRNRYRAGVWKILLKDHLPAYISWDRYEANQKRLQDNLQRARRPACRARATRCWQAWPSAVVAVGGSNPVIPIRVIPITSASGTVSMSKSRFAPASWPG